MSSHWRELKIALGLHRPLQSSPAPSVRNRIKTPSGSSSSSSASKKSCAICLDAMKPGQGQAMFTAECGHTFHFQCITANVKHGNKACPICRTRWKDVPFGERVPEPFAVGTSTVSALQEAPMVLDFAPRFGFGSVSRGTRRPSEPRIFDDDAYVCAETVSPGDDGVERAAVQVEMHPEVSAVSGLSVHKNFNVLINVKAPYREIGTGGSGGPRVPVDIVTVLDVSGSMEGRKITLLKQAMRFVIENLGPSDRLSVVTFSTSASRQFPLICMNEEGKQRAIENVESLTCNGGTNIAEGLIKGTKVIMDRKWKNPVVSLILLSDGKDTCGHSDYRTLIPTNSVDTAARIQIHAFGFGADHDASLMHSIAENSGGTFSFIESDDAIQDAFAQCLGGLLSVVVQELKLEMECIHPNLRLNSIEAGSYNTSISSDGRKGCIHAGDLYTDEERNFLVSMFIPEEKSFCDMPLLQAKYTFKDPKTNSVVNVEVGTQLCIQRPEIVKDATMSLKVDKQRNRQRAAEVMAEARVLAEKGELGRAVSVLKASRKLLEGSTSSSSDESWIDLCNELKEMEERMSTRQRYESSGRGYVLSGLSSHQRQRATTKGDSSKSGSMAYRTRFMSEMVEKSQSSQLFETSEQRPKSSPSRRPHC